MALLQWLFLFITVILLLKFLLRDISSDEKQRQLPPSPTKLPIIGNIHQLGKNPHISLQTLAKKLGPIMYLRLGKVPTVVVSSAQLAKEVMKTHDLVLASRPQIFSAKHLLYNCTDIAFAPYGDYWRNVRKICILELLSVKRVQSFRPEREEGAARMVQRIAESSCHGKTNLTKILGYYANDVVCHVAFGRDFSGGGDYDKHGFQRMLEELQELLGGLSIGDLFPSVEFIHSLTGMKRRLQDTFKRFDRLLDEILQEHIQSSGDKHGHKDLIDVLLDMQKNHNSEMPLPMDNVKAIIFVDLLKHVAGHVCCRN